MNDTLERFQRTKKVLVGLIFVVVGIVLLTVSKVLPTWPNLAWIAVLPWGEIGGILIGAGVFSIWLDSYFEREKQQADDERLQRLFIQQAPAMRDAVINGFAFHPDDLARVSTPAMLDQIIRNSLAIRLGDKAFATEIYDDIRDQAVRATERWHDAKVSIRLSPLSMDGGTPAGSTSPEQETVAPLYVVSVRWEYTVVPHHQIRRFACVSDHDDYNELGHDDNGTSVWYFTPKSGVDATSRDAFDLVQFTVDGEERSVRRSTRKSGQVYAVNLGEDVIEAGKPVTVAYTYRTVTARDGHMLYFDIEQPTRGIEVELDYGDCDIAHVSVLDLIASSRKTRIERTPTAVPGRAVRIDFDGWVFPRSGVAFVWSTRREGTAR